jgi:hypothetical protein
MRLLQAQRFYTDREKLLNALQRIQAFPTRAARLRPLTESFISRLTVGLTILTFADYFNLIRLSSAEVSSAFKYSFFLLVAVTFALIAIRSKQIRLGLNAPTIFLAFTIVTAIPFLVQSLSGGEVNSYLTAFAASMVYSTSAVLPWNKYQIEPEAIEKFLLRWVLVLGVLYIGELSLRRFAGLEYFNHFETVEAHIKAIALVVALSLICMGRAKWSEIALTMILSAACIMLRPSSSFILCVIVSIPVALLLRLRYYRAAEYICYGLIISAMLVPFLLYASADVGRWIGDVETSVKVDIFDAVSNTEFRLINIKLALDRFVETHWLVGEMFSGPTNVFIAGHLPYWAQNVLSGLAAIHSDYVILILQGGLIGYGLFNLALVMIVRNNIRRLRRLDRHGESISLRGIVGLALPMVTTLVVYCSANPFLQEYQVALVLWFVLAISEIVAVAAEGKLKVQGRTAD